MITKVYITHSEEDEPLARELAEALWRVGLESFVAIYKHARGISPGERIRFGIRHSDCVIALLTLDGVVSPRVNQEIGFASGIDQLVIPLLEVEAEMPVLIRHLKPIQFSRETYSDALGEVILNIRDMTALEWLKIKCPFCGEEMTQYLPPQEVVDRAVLSNSGLDTICSYCET
ncbi:MAG TPA: toll/interleukin-1 receptor domain-containing protein, partial [Methanotrichaceae archaeon]|nr:toll/interleukin-1 receptor domain-containing protein [Methanotrichaceae archaeon]